MPLIRTHFDVLMDPPPAEDDHLAEPAEFRVEIRAVDQLKAEFEGKRRGFELGDAMHTTYLWAWCAMVREGHYDGKFEMFKEQCITAMKVKDDQGEPVDPTRPAATSDSA